MAKVLDLLGRMLGSGPNAPHCRLGKEGEQQKGPLAKLDCRYRGSFCAWNSRPEEAGSLN